MIIGDGIMLGAGGESASIFVTGLSETDNVSATHKIPGKVLNPEWKVPDGYTQLEYIESTGTQYIDTGKRYDDGVRVCTTLRYDSSSNLGFGAASSSGRQYLNVNSDKFQFGWGSGSSYTLVSNILTYNKWYTADAKLLNQNVNLDIDGATVVSTSSTINTPKLNFYLFCVNVDGSPLIQSGKRYAMCETVIYGSTGNMDAHYIPCKRNSDSSVGMYDLISSTFFENDGTGTFVAGAEIPQYIDGYVDEKTIIGKWTQTPNPLAHGLPDGYTELEYIEGDGNQYINTGYSSKNNFGARSVVEWINLGSGGIIYNAYGSMQTSGSNTYYISLALDNNRGDGVYYISLGSNGTTGYYGPAGSANTKYDIRANYKGDGRYSTDDYVKQESGIWFSEATSPIYLFATWFNGSPGRYAKMKCYEIEFTEGKNTVHHYIPCKRNSDNTIGMYDLVSNTFFGNSGTGTFVAGAEIPQTIDGFMIDKIKEYGTWTVTATNGTNTATQDVLVDAADVFSIKMGYLYYTEQELLDMGMRISRTIGDQIKCNGRYIQRVATTPLAVCRVNYSSGYMGYAIISNAPVTESFALANEYSPVIQIGGDNLTAYVYGMKFAWPTSSGYSVYLNNNVVTYAFTANGSDRTIADEYIDTINHIASSILYLR